MTSVYRLDDNLVESAIAQQSYQISRIIPSQQSPFSQFIKRGNIRDKRWIANITYGDLEQGIGKNNERSWINFELFLNRNDGGAGIFSMYDITRPIPKGIATGIGREDQQVPFDNGVLHTDGVGFAEPDTKAMISGRSKKGATSVSITGVLPNQPNTNAINSDPSSPNFNPQPSNYSLRAGDIFSIVHDPFHIEIHYEVLYDAESDANGIVTVTIDPPLAYGVNELNLVNFLRPRSPFILVRDPQIDVRQGKIGTTVMQAIEAREIIGNPKLLSVYMGIENA